MRTGAYCHAKSHRPAAAENGACNEVKAVCCRPSAPRLLAAAALCPIRLPARPGWRLAPSSCSPPSAFGTDLTGANAQYWRIKAAGLAHCVLFFQEGKQSRAGQGSTEQMACPLKLKGQTAVPDACFLLSYRGVTWGMSGAAHAYVGAGAMACRCGLCVCLRRCGCMRARSRRLREVDNAVACQSLAGNFYHLKDTDADIGGPEGHVQGRAAAAMHTSVDGLNIPPPLEGHIAMHGFRPCPHKNPACCCAPSAQQACV